MLRLDFFAVPRITGIRVARPRISDSILSRSGGRWVTTTNANPLPAGRDLKNCSSASTPPAEAPMPTMGRLGIMIFTLRAYASFILLLVFIRSNGCWAPLFRMRSAGTAAPRQVVEIDGNARLLREVSVSGER